MSTTGNYLNANQRQADNTGMSVLSVLADHLSKRADEQHAIQLQAQQQSEQLKQAQRMVNLLNSSKDTQSNIQSDNSIVGRADRNILNPTYANTKQINPPANSAMSLVSGGYGDVNGNAIQSPAQDLMQTANNNLPQQKQDARFSLEPKVTNGKYGFSIADNQATMDRLAEKAATAGINPYNDQGQPKTKTQIFSEMANSKGPDSLQFSEKQSQFNQKEWDKLTKEVNPLTTSGRNPLGMAMKANYNANRALSTLSNPMVTNQEAGNVMADIASIYQNGSPTQFGMSEQSYKTVASRLAGAVQYLTGKPQDALTPDIKNRLIDVLTGMKKTNFDVVKQNLDYTEKAKAKLIQSFPQEWQDMKDTLMSDAYSGLDKNTGGQGIDQKIQQARDAGYSEQEIQAYLQGKK